MNFPQLFPPEAIALKVFMVLQSLSSVAEKMVEELNLNSSSSEHKRDSLPELKLNRLDSASGA